MSRRAIAGRQTEQRHVRSRVPRSATVRRERAPVTSRLLLVVRLSSERVRQAVRQDCSCAKTQASPPALLVVVESGGRGRCGPRLDERRESRAPDRRLPFRSGEASVPRRLPQAIAARPERRLSRTRRGRGVDRWRAHGRLAVADARGCGRAASSSTFGCLMVSSLPGRVARADGSASAGSYRRRKPGRR